MIGDKAKGVIIEDMIQCRLNPRCLTSKTQKLPKLGDNPITNDDFFFTSGCYFLTFKPSDGPNVPKKSKFILKCDFFRGSRHRCMSYRMIEDFANKGRWEFIFLRDWTTISQRTFDIAANNLNVDIPFVFKIEEYCDMLKEQNNGELWNILREKGMNEIEQKRANMVKSVKWQVPVKIEV